MSLNPNANEYQPSDITNIQKLFYYTIFFKKKLWQLQKKKS